MKNLLYRPNMLERKRVEQALLEAKNLPFILVVAPMGYGKTSVVQSYLSKVEGKKIWFTLGQNESDSEWIWKRLLESLEGYGYLSKEQLDDMTIPKTQYEVSHFLKGKEELLNEPFYLVIDDCHECKNDDFVPLLEALIYNQLNNFQLIMISRSYPKIHYEEIWIKGHCVLLEQAFLALTKEEEQEFFEINEIRLTEEENNYLYEYTEGWISAAYLILLDYKKNGTFSNFGGINSLVRNFLFEPLPKECQYILICMSLLDEFTSEQAAYITEIGASTYLMPELYDTIGFIKYESEQKQYQIHGVLKSVVKKELELLHIDSTCIYERAGKWYEKERNYIKALKYFRKSGNIEQCFGIIEQNSCAILYDKAPKVICELFEQVSKKEKLAHPKAYLSFLYERLLSENSAEMRFLFEEIKEWYEEKLNSGKVDRDILGELEIIEWNLKFNHLDEMIKCAKKAYEFLEGKQSRIFNSDLILTYGTPEVVTLYHNQVGKLKETVELEKQFTTYYMKIINGYDGGWDLFFDAEYYLITGNFEKAKILADQVCEKAIYKNQFCVLISGYFIRLQIVIYEGNRDKFELYLKELEYYLREFEYKRKDTIRPVLLMDYELTVSYVNGIIGRTENVALWVKEFDLKQCNRIVRSARIGCITYGIWLIQNKNFSRLEVLAEEMSVPFRDTNHVIVDIYAHIFYAISRCHLSSLNEGVVELEKAINLAKPDGIKMPFVENIIELEPLLRKLTLENKYVNQILILGEKQKEGIKAFKIIGEQENLTKRELELMKLVERGYKNIEISKELNIAQVTVEKTLTSVYRKLNVKSRTAALAKLKTQH